MIDIDVPLKSDVIDRDWIGKWSSCNFVIDSSWNYVSPLYCICKCIISQVVSEDIHPSYHDWHSAFEKRFYRQELNIWKWACNNIVILLEFCLATVLHQQTLRAQIVPVHSTFIEWDWMRIKSLCNLVNKSSSNHVSVHQQICISKWWWRWWSSNLSIRPIVNVCGLIWRTQVGPLAKRSAKDNCNPRTHNHTHATEGWWSWWW